MAGIAIVIRKRQIVDRLQRRRLERELIGAVVIHDRVIVEPLRHLMTILRAEAIPQHVFIKDAADNRASQIRKNPRAPLLIVRRDVVFDLIPKGIRGARQQPRDDVMLAGVML